MRYFVEEIEDLDGLGVTAFTSVPQIHAAARNTSSESQPQPVSSGHPKTIHLAKRGVLIRGKTGPTRIHATPRAPTRPVQTNAPIDVAALQNAGKKVRAGVHAHVNAAALNTARKIHAGVLASRGSRLQALSRGQTIVGGSMTGRSTGQPGQSQQTLVVNQNAADSMHSVPRNEPQVEIVDEPQVEIVDGTQVDTAPVESAPVETTMVDNTTVDTAPVESAPVEYGWNQIHNTELYPTDPVAEEVVYTNGGSSSHDPLVDTPAVEPPFLPDATSETGMCPPGTARTVAGGPCLPVAEATPPSAPEKTEKKGISPLAVLALLAGGYFLLNS